MTWPEARAFCESRGWALARIDSDEEARIVHDAAIEEVADDWWIGLSDRDNEGTFEWADEEPVDYTNWSDGEPDLYRCGEDCGAFKERDHLHWRDLHCATRLPFICRH